MGRIGLQLRATLENITRLRAEGEDFRWYLKLKCGNCGEVSEKWQYLRLMDSAPLKGGRGSATMVQKCKLCSRENSIGTCLDPDQASSISQLSLQSPALLGTVCKELSPGISSLLHWCLSSQQAHPGHHIQGLAEDSEKFKTIVEFECRGLEPVDFQPQDWNDYDEKTKESVGIYEVTHKFVKC
ncbi:CXXC motif containing zinc binding protein isoform 2-T2 [Sylvia borin]